MLRVQSDLHESISYFGLLRRGASRNSFARPQAALPHLFSIFKLPIAEVAFFLATAQIRITKKAGAIAPAFRFSQSHRLLTHRR